MRAIREVRPILMLHETPVDYSQMKSEMEPVFEKRTGWKRIYPDLPGMEGLPLWIV